jgi:hypothetical protein
LIHRCCEAAKHGSGKKGRAGVTYKYLESSELITRSINILSLRFFGHPKIPSRGESILVILVLLFDVSGSIVIEEVSEMRGSIGQVEAMQLPFSTGWRGDNDIAADAFGIVVSVSDDITASF